MQSRQKLRPQRSNAGKRTDVQVLQNQHDFDCNQSGTGTIYDLFGKYECRQTDRISQTINEIEQQKNILDT